MARHEITSAVYTPEELRGLAEDPPTLLLSAHVKQAIIEGAEFVLRLSARDSYLYGINTGFGDLSEKRIQPHDMAELQRRHLLSHAAGIGEPVPERISRLVLLIKLLTFRSGRTGVSLAVVDRLIDMWNASLIPVIPRKGTVGASGDLAPLAHFALPLIGVGDVHYEGAIVPASVVLDKLGWQPLNLEPKDGLALTNGVQYINALGVDAVATATGLAKVADVTAALSLQAFSCSETLYDPMLHGTSLHPERMQVANNLTALLDGSNHHLLTTCNKAKQDPYSFRCAPQVHAAVRQALGFAHQTLTRECNSVSDNPLFFAESERMLMGGNLHGESTAMALDFMAIAVSELANISERRTYQLLSGRRGLPDFLVGDPGLNSGLMISQYTSAALVNENKVLSTPACVDTIPTSQLQEDHVSMGGTSAYKLAQVIENCEFVLGIELMTATQAVELSHDLVLSEKTEAVLRAFRREVAFLEVDRILAADIDAARAFVGELRRGWVAELE